MSITTMDNFQWPSSPAEKLYGKLYSDEHTKHIASMYYGAAVLVHIQELETFNNPEMIRQFCHSIREVIEKYGFISRGPGRTPTNFTKKGEELLECYVETLHDLNPFDQTLFESVESKENVLVFLNHYQKFYSLKNFERKEKKEELIRTIELKSPRLTENNKDLIKIANGLSKIHALCNDTVHSTNIDKVSTIDMKSIFQDVTDVMLKIMSSHEVDGFDDLSYLVHIVEDDDE